MTDMISLCNNQYLYLCDYNQIINSAIKDLFLENSRDRKVTTTDVPISKEILINRIIKLPQIIFEVSANCNLRCKYCVYNNNYYNQRELSPILMNTETSKKALDYIYNFIKNRKDKTLSLSFYGGEPMMNMKTVKNIIEYGKKLFSQWELYFNMTTNLTLLNPDILKLLVENNIALMVSLDGGKENHDSKRVYTNNTGTFDTVIENLRKIHAYNSDYFRRKVSFSSVFSFDLSLIAQYNFFNTNPLIQKSRIRFSTVNTFDTTYYESYPYKKDEFDRDIKTIFSSIKTKIRNNEELTGYETYLFSDFKKIGEALKGRRHTTLGGSCLFDSRLFIDAEGRFHVCEKINQTFSFGDVEKGFDFDKMSAITHDFIQTQKEICGKCNLKYLCTVCFASFGGNEKFRINSEFCRTQRQVITANLENYIQCKEEKLI